MLQSFLEVDCYRDAIALSMFPPVSPRVVDSLACAGVSWWI